MRRKIDKQKEALLEEIRSVMADVESFYEEGVERGEAETRAFKAKLQEQLDAAQAKLQSFEEQAVEQVKHHAKVADDYVNAKPYYAIGLAGLAGLVVGILLNRR